MESKVLAKVQEYQRHHENNPAVRIRKPIKPGTTMNELVSEWDANFIDVPMKELVQIINAANSLKIPGLIDLGVDKMATLIVGKNADEVERMLS